MKKDIQFPFELRPSSLVVFEGLDNAGKSTVHGKLLDATHPDGQDGPPAPGGEPLFADPVPYFTHQPSGGSSSVGRKIYKLTEEVGGDLNPRARQMLHLASHYQHYDADIIPRLESGQSVFMDRNYWSTFAYGYYGDGGFHEDMDPEGFLTMVSLPARSYVPDVVFYFSHVWTKDHHNTPEVRKGYDWLVDYHGSSVVHVPRLTPDETIMFVFRVLRERGITKVYR